MEPFDHWSILRNLSDVPSLSSYHDFVLSEFSGSKYSKGKGRKPSPWRYPFHFRYCWRNRANSTQEYFFPFRTRSRLRNCNFLEGRYQEVLSFHLFPAQLAIVSSWNVSFAAQLEFLTRRKTYKGAAWAEGREIKRTTRQLTFAGLRTTIKTLRSADHSIPQKVKTVKSN